MDAGDPVVLRDGVVVDVGDVGGVGGPGAGVARGADPRQVDADEAGAVEFGDEVGELLPGGAGRAAVHDQHGERTGGVGLPAQAVQAVLDVARPVMGADADRELHAGRLGLAALTKA